MLIGRSGWWVNALQIMSDCVQKPNQPSLWTSPLLARIHALALISKPGAWRQTSERQGEGDNRRTNITFTTLANCGTLLSPLRIFFLLRVRILCVFCTVLPAFRSERQLSRRRTSVSTREKKARYLDFYFILFWFPDSRHPRRGMFGIWHLDRWRVSLLSDKKFSSSLTLGIGARFKKDV